MNSISKYQQSDRSHYHQEENKDLLKVGSATGHSGLPFHKQILAGASAGLIEVLVMYPLDVVKTRLQLQKGNAKYKSIASTFSVIIKEEGFRNLYRGIISPILAEAPKRAVKFASNEQFKTLFPYKDGKPTNLGASAAGALAGATEAFINCPFEVVKVRMIAPDALSIYRDSFDALFKIIKQEGPFALYKGFEAQLWRNMIWNGAYFGTINFTKENLWTPKTKGSEMGRNFLAGFLAGSLATCLNTPLDVVKSRLQNTRTGKRAMAFEALYGLYREEGFRACYKGLAPRLLRLGPGGGIMLLAFDLVSSWLK